MWELDHKEGRMAMNLCFWTAVLQKTLESQLDCKEIQPVHPTGNQPWIFIGRTEAEAPKLWPPDVKSQLTGKTLMLGKIESNRRRGWQDEMVGWHHRLYGCEFVQAPWDGKGQGSLAYYSPWGHKESDRTEQLNNKAVLLIPSCWHFTLWILSTASYH